MWLPIITRNLDKVLVNYITKNTSRKILYPLSISGVTKHCGTNDITRENNIISMYDCSKEDFNIEEVPNSKYSK